MQIPPSWVCRHWSETLQDPPALLCSQLLAGDSRLWQAAMGLLLLWSGCSTVTGLCLSAALAEHFSNEPDAAGLAFPYIGKSVLKGNGLPHI